MLLAPFRRFGFPNKKALDDGLTGTDCRGEEHEVNVVWSLTSGKRHVTMDSKEVHYSTSRQGILDFSFTTKGNHVIKIICHAAPPLSATPGFRQYDLLIDGQSFFTMPKMYELGVRGDSKYNRVPGYTGANNYSNPTSPITLGSGTRSYPSNEYASAAPHNRAEEEADLRRAIEASIQESRAHLGKGGDDRSHYTAPPPQGGGGNTADLLDFGGGGAVTNPTPSPHDARSVSSYYTAPTTYNQHPPSAPAYQSPPPQQVAAPGALVPSHGPAGYYSAPPPPQAANSFATPPPVPPAPAPTPSFASPPSQEPMYSPAYGQPPAAPAYQPQAAPAYQPQPPAPAYAQNLMNTPPPQSNDVFGLNSPPGDDPFAPKAPPPPSYTDLATSVSLSFIVAPPQFFVSLLFLQLFGSLSDPLSLHPLQIMGAYTSPPPGAPATPGSAAPGTPGAQNGFATPQGNGQAAAAPNGGVTMSMHALTITEEEKPKDSFDSALKKLVNVDHIDEPAEGEIKLTMMKKEEEKKKKKGKSEPLPPVASNFVGSGATLADIKTARPVSCSFLNCGFFCLSACGF